jgi:hypothetical protein
VTAVSSSITPLRLLNTDMMFSPTTRYQGDGTNDEKGEHMILLPLSQTPRTFQLSLCVLRSTKTFFGSPGPYHLSSSSSSSKSTVIVGIV